MSCDFREHNSDSRFRDKMLHAGKEEEEAPRLNSRTGVSALTEIEG